MFVYLVPNKRQSQRIKRAAAPVWHASDATMNIIYQYEYNIIKHCPRHPSQPARSATVCPSWRQITSHGFQYTRIPSSFYGDRHPIITLGKQIHLRGIPSVRSTSQVLACPLLRNKLPCLLSSDKFEYSSLKLMSARLLRKWSRVRILVRCQIMIIIISHVHKCLG